MVLYTRRRKHSILNLSAIASYPHVYSSEVRTLQGCGFNVDECPRVMYRNMLHWSWVEIRGPHSGSSLSMV